MENLKEAQTVRWRLILAGMLVGIMTLVLLGRLFYLQVYSYQNFASQSVDNRIQAVPVPPERGLIFDRNGILLASNHPVHELVVEPYRVSNVGGLVNEISRIIEIDGGELESFNRSRKRSSGYNEHVLKTRLSDEEIARIAVQRYQLNGASIKAEMQRFYPEREIVSHILGRVGRIDVKDESRIDPAQYRGLKYIGKSGIELAMEDLLVGVPGYEQVETNAHGRQVRQLSRISPESGKNVYLTIDAELQKIAYDAMGDYAGAVVAMEPSTGRVLAMVSKPSYDPNLLVSGLSTKEFRQFLRSKDNPLINRAIQGVYSPGSTIKVFLALAAYELETKPEKVFCPGYYVIPGKSRKYRCWKETGHGYIDALEAVIQSCDVYFYKLADKMGISEIYYRLSRFGFGAPTNVGLQHEESGILPSPEWKQYALGEKWYRGETLSVGIGQGYTLVTIMQLAQAVSIIANRGVSYAPQVIHKVVDINTEEILEFQPKMTGKVELENNHYYDLIIDSMVGVLHSEKGTARRVGRELKNFQAAGKTGTIQVISKTEKDLKEQNIEITEKMRPQGAFVSFAPVENPEIVVAVLAEHSGSGGGVAASVARDMMNYYIVDRKNSPSQSKSQLTMN